MKSTNQSQKLVLGALCAVVFLVVFWQFSWKARANTLSKASDVRAATQAKQADLAAAKKAKANEEANKAELAAAQTALPASADAQGVIRLLTQLAATSGVSWDNVTLGTLTTGKDSGNLQSIPLSITLSGTMDQFEAYLQNLRGADVSRLLVVDTFNTAFGADPADPSKLSASLTVNAFMYTAAAAPATGSSGATATNTVTSTPVGTVPTAVQDNTNVGATPTTAQG